MKKIIFGLLLIIFATKNVYSQIYVHSQIQEEWLIGNNKIKFVENSNPIVTYINKELFSYNSIKLDGINYSIVMDNDYKYYIVNHNDLTEIELDDRFGQFTTDYSLKFPVLIKDNQNNIFLYKKGFVHVLGDTSGSTDVYNFENKYNTSFQNYNLNDNNVITNESHIDHFSTYGYGKNSKKLSSKYLRDYIFVPSIIKQNNSSLLKLSSYEINNGVKTSEHNINLNISGFTDLLSKVSHPFYTDYQINESNIHTIVKTNKDLTKIGILFITDSKYNKYDQNEIFENLTPTLSNIKSFFFTADFNSQNNTLSNLKFESTPKPITLLNNSNNYTRDFEFSDNGNLVYYIVQPNAMNTKERYLIEVNLVVKDLITKQYRIVNNSQNNYLNKTILNKIHKDPLGNIIIYGRKKADPSISSAEFYKVNNNNDYNNSNYSFYFNLPYETNRTMYGSFTLPQYYPFIKKTSVFGNTNDLNEILYPNPNNGNFKVEYVETPQKIEIFDLNSSTIYINNKPEINSTKINLENIKSGYYILKLYYENDISTINFRIN